MSDQNDHDIYPVSVKTSLSPGASLPMKGREKDVGYDLTACKIERAPKSQQGTHTFLVHFGVTVEPPPGYYFEIIPRSSLAWSGFILPNSVGVIDPDYRGQLMMPLIYIARINSNDEASAKVQVDQIAQELVGKRLAQLVLRQHLSCQFDQVTYENLSRTIRGEQGFGSSGD